MVNGTGRQESDCLPTNHKQPTTNSRDRGEQIISKAFDTQRNEFSVASEKAVLVSVALPDRPWATSDPCDEIRGLATTAGATVVAELTQKRQDIQLATYIGSGKLGDLAELVQSTDADVVIFDNDLSPAQ